MLHSRDQETSSAFISFAVGPVEIGFGRTNYKQLGSAYESQHEGVGAHQLSGPILTDPVVLVHPWSRKSKGGPVIFERLVLRKCTVARAVLLVTIPRIRLPFRVRVP